MNVRNCRKCGKIFNYVLGPIMCPRCRDEQEAKFQEVKKYVSEHYGADIVEVSDVCDVDPSQIRQWIREERLQFADDSPIRIPCEKCGAMIRSGRYCDSCKMEMTQGFKQAMGRDRVIKQEEKKAPARSGNDRMRFL